MIVDRRKDNYDELQILAGDARTRRRRANMWTTGLIASAMILASAYVSTTNEQANALGAAKRSSETERDNAKEQLAEANNYIAVLKAEREAYKQSATWLASMAPQLDLSNAVRNLNFVFPGRGEKLVTEERLSNVVWVVDGSRRFPVTNGDILWIPEGNFWVQLESPDSSDPPNPTDTLPLTNAEPPKPRPLRKVTFYYDRRPTNGATGGIARYLGGADRYYEELGKWPAGTHGNSDCVQLTLHYNSRRPGFSDPKYLDMEVLLYNSDEKCPINGHVVPPP